LWGEDVHVGVARGEVASRETRDRESLV
jgi:hypothetical protein